LPENAELAVKVGDNVRGGLSVLARILEGVPSKIVAPEKSRSAQQKLTEESGTA